MDEVEKARDEVQQYQLSGGATICEMSVVGMRRAGHRVADLKSISESTGVNIVAATGFYCDRFLPDWVRQMSVRDLAGYMSSEVGRGVEGSDGVKCGVMYIGCSYPLTDLEKRSLEAAAITHKETGISPISLLPSFPLSPLPLSPLSSFPLSPPSPSQFLMLFQWKAS
jgi:phosphotriesterase-related protein